MRTQVNSYLAEEIRSEHQQYSHLENQWHANNHMALVHSLVEMLPQPHIGSLYVPRLVRSNSSIRGGTALA